MKSNRDHEKIGQESRAIWNENAAFWDAHMGEGDLFRRELIHPITEELLAVKPGERLLDIACGNGVFSRRLAALGASVIASDFSARLIELARARTTEHRDRIEFRVVDATSESELVALGMGQYDGAVCTMALMDMMTIEPLFSALGQLLKPGGRFVFSVMHPCFNSTGVSMLVEQQEDESGDFVVRYSVKVSRYISPEAKKGVAMLGQPRPQYYFHRPLGELLGAAFKHGFVLDALVEPSFDPQVKAESPLGWDNYKEIPPALVARLRLPT